MNEQQVEAFARNFYEVYLTHHGIQEVLELLDDEICWSGHYAATLLTSHAEVEGMLKRIAEGSPPPMDISYIHQITRKVAEGWYLSNAHMTLSFHNKETTPFPLYASLFLHETSGSLRLRQVHFSLFGTEKQIIEAIAENMKEEDRVEYERKQLRQTLKLKMLHDDLRMLTDNVPGGIFRCRDDEKLTIEYMSEGFLNMLGYTRRMIEEKYHNSFQELIYEEDRESTHLEVMRQMKKSKFKQLEYRLKHADGHAIWVLDRGQLIEKPDTDVPSYYCIVIDVTEEKRIREELNLTLERYHIIMQQTDDVIFEWDIKEDHMTISANWNKVFAQAIPDHPAFTLLHKKSGELLYEKDREKLLNIIKKVEDRVGYMEEEVRLLGADREYIWCRLRITTQLDHHGQPIKAIGVIVNIDEEKKKTQRLRSIAETDSLTGMYNKITAQTRIRKYLSCRVESQRSALMIIDIDNFKLVNDTMGHLFGDAVLAEISEIIKKSFRRSDIVGRIGGDEFIVFMKDIEDNGKVNEHAESIIQKMHELKSVEKSGISISVSIGIALCPDDGVIFKDLYQKADHALYQAKKEGKNTYALYDESRMDSFISNTETKLRSLVNETIDSNSAHKAIGSSIAEYVFRTLYKTRDMHTAISAILSVIGTRFDVSRVYIFENTGQDAYCRNTFEWCGEGVEPQIHKLQNVSYEQDLGGNYLDNFNAEGIFYCSDIASLPSKQYNVLAPQGIKALLQCAITDNGEFCGFVGFDECRVNRYWDQSQIDALVFISEILSTFLLKSHAQDSWRQESESLRDALNNQHSLIYIMNPTTHELLFLNKMTKQYCPDGKIGMPCYKVLLHREAPCEECQAQNIHKGCPHIVNTVYNEYLNLHCETEASYIRWKGTDAVLVCCHDIAKYQK